MRSINLNVLKSYLEEEGFRPTINGDFLRFKFESGEYLLAIDDDDATYVRILFPNFWEIKEGERTKILESLNYTTANVKAAKVFIIENKVWASVEFFAADEGAVKAVFLRCLAALQGATDQFVNQMKS